MKRDNINDHKLINLEQPLRPYEACNLGSINLANHVKYEFPHDKRGTKKIVIDYDKLKSTIYSAVHFLDNVIDANHYPIPEIDKNTKETRKIGLGIMGFADLLFILGIPYNSKEGLDIAEEVMEFIQLNSKVASKELAETRGTYPVYDQVVKDHPEYNIPYRNLYVTTIAPTGTISMIAGTSGGIEPAFAISYFKQCMDGNKFMEVNPYFKQAAIERGFYSEELMKEVIAKGSLHDIDGIPEDVKKVFCTSHEISPEWHVRMQATFQEYTDNAISKTINFSNSATEEDIKTAYLLAYKLGCKGITVYRDGSRQNQVLNLNTSDDKKEDKKCDDCTYAECNVLSTEPKERSEYMNGFTRRMAIGCGKLYVTINTDEDGNPFEIFTSLGKSGGCPSQTEASARLASLAFRSGIDPQAVIKQLRGIKCPNTINMKAKNDNIKCLSCPDAIARTLEEYLNSHNITKTIDNTIISDSSTKVIPNTTINTNSKCPECGAELINKEGCLSCLNCGYSKCN